MTTVPAVFIQRPKRLDWQTPQDFFDKINARFYFQLDPCTSPDNPLGTPKFYTEADNGLYQLWAPGPVYCNPPFGAKNIKPWIFKAMLEQSNGVTTVMLLPAHMSDIWMHNYVLHREPKITYEFIKGRLTFCGAKNNAPSGHMLVYFWGDK
jgi:phage N-6-adenine-methyltransferase